MRKGFDGLIGLVMSGARADPYSGHLFVFLSKRRDRAKILIWDRSGFVLYCKRLERGRFQLSAIVAGATSIELEGAQLVMLLEGIDLKTVKPAPRNAGHERDRVSSQHDGPFRRIAKVR